MEIKELEKKLEDAQQRLDKAVVLKAKYETKFETAKQEIEKLGYDPETLRYGNVSDPILYHQLQDLSWKYSEAKDGIHGSTNKIKDLTRIRDNWKTKLEVQKAKENEFETIPQIVKDFVHKWRVATFDFVMNDVKNAELAYQDVKKLYDEAVNYGYYTPEYKEAYNAYSIAARQYKEDFSQLTRSLAFSKNKEAELNKILDIEEKEKVLDLIRRVTKVVGTITDASNLSIGNQSGELNGIVVGENGKAHVQTIGAGGYNIQRFHYRVLVKEIH